jgi:hypothetical protein
MASPGGIYRKFKVKNIFFFHFKARHLRKSLSDYWLTTSTTDRNFSDFTTMNTQFAKIIWKSHWTSRWQKPSTSKTQQ